MGGFIHLIDLAEGYKLALEVLEAPEDQILTLKLGSGKGHSLLKMTFGVMAWAWAPAEPRRLSQPQIKPLLQGGRHNSHAKGRNSPQNVQR